MSYSSLLFFLGDQIQLACISISAAMAVFLDYLLQLTAFVALLTYDLKRTEAKRVDCFPCFSSTVHEDDSSGFK